MITIDGSQGEGGAQSMAPPFDFLENCFMPLMRRMGPSVELELQRHVCSLPVVDDSMRGFITSKKLSWLVLLEGGPIRGRQARVLVSKIMSQNTNSLDSTQSASAAQFNRQSDRYGKSHILADTQDIELGLSGVTACVGSTALDVATGGGHTALWLARHGWKVTVGDIAPRMLENAQKLCAEEGFNIETRLFPAEEMPFADGSFDLVTVRVAPHHFSSPQKFVRETARVLKSGGHFLLIDGTVPDHDPETEEWLHRLEKWRDPSHGRFLSRTAWEEVAEEAGLEVVRSDLHPRKQPDLNWYLETAATPDENRLKVLEAVAKASEHVRVTLRLGNEEGKIVWWWPMLTLLAYKQ